jgi:hypothetical protein
VRELELLELYGGAAFPASRMGKKAQELPDERAGAFSPALLAVLISLYLRIFFAEPGRAKPKSPERG